MNCLSHPSTLWLSLGSHGLLFCKTTLGYRVSDKKASSKNVSQPAFLKGASQIFKIYHNKLTMAKYTSQFNNLLYDLYLYATHRPLCKFLDFFLQNNFCLGTPLAQTLMMSPLSSHKVSPAKLLTSQNVKQLKRRTVVNMKSHQMNKSDK